MAGRTGQAEGKDEEGKRSIKHVKKKKKNWFKNSSSRMRSCTLGPVIRQFDLNR